MSIQLQYLPWLKAKPEVPTLDAWLTHNGEMAQAWCVYCLHWHEHGPYEGHRQAHCVLRCSPYKDTGYNIHVVGDFKQAPAEVKRLKEQECFCFNCQRPLAKVFEHRCICHYINKAYGEPGGVYLLQCLNRYKIGRGKDVAQRVKQIQTNAPYEVRHIHTITTDNAARLEALLHVRFASKRVLGEWFELSAEDVAYITSL